MKKILFAASECEPFIRTGRLAEVCRALPEEFDASEWDIRVVIPDYSCISAEFRNQFKPAASFYMSAGPLIHDKYVGVMTFRYHNITYYFIDNQEYFTCEKPYGDIRSDIEHFVYFDKAVLSMLPLIGFKPDIIHCHDWQTGLIPVYLKNEFLNDPFFHGIRTIMTIHNLRYKGIWDIRTMQELTGFGNDMFTIRKLEFKKDASMLKGGLIFADYITTVSYSYAKEIQLETYGEGLDGIMSQRHMDMQGIINGIDYGVFDPISDPRISVNYCAIDWQSGKAENKKTLQEELGLAVDPHQYVIGMIAELNDEKGLDLLAKTLDAIVDDFTQFIIIGSGNPEYEDMLRNHMWIHPERMFAYIGNSNNLKARLYAGADAILIPSSIEPCGTRQLVAFHYGTVPIVRETGGLKDTVKPYNEFSNEGDGFSFRNHNAEEMLRVINYSKQVFFDHHDRWEDIVTRGMHNDFSWSTTRVKYEGLYDYLIQR